MSGLSKSTPQKFDNHDNTAISGFALSGNDPNQADVGDMSMTGITTEGQSEPEIAFKPQITEGAVTPASLDKEVNALLSEAVITASADAQTSVGKPWSIKEAVENAGEFVDTPVVAPAISSLQTEKKPAAAPVDSSLASGGSSEADFVGKLAPKSEPPSVPTTSLAFNALAAFVAGLAVVGVVYAFAVQGELNQYKSIVLGESTESR